METYLHVGGLVAAGFNATGEYLLTITHSGRGVFETRTWKRVARDIQLAYPEKGRSIGIGPIDGIEIPVAEMNFDVGSFELRTPDGKLRLRCESSGIDVSEA